jgi:hypothetical protein
MPQHSEERLLAATCKQRRACWAARATNIRPPGDTRLCPTQVSYGVGHNRPGHQGDPLPPTKHPGGDSVCHHVPPTVCKSPQEGHTKRPCIAWHGVPAARLPQIIAPASAATQPLRPKHPVQPPTAQCSNAGRHTCDGEHCHLTDSALSFRVCSAAAAQALTASSVLQATHSTLGALHTNVNAAQLPEAFRQGLALQTPCRIRCASCCHAAYVAQAPPQHASKGFPHMSCHVMLCTLRKLRHPIQASTASQPWGPQAHQNRQPSCKLTTLCQPSLVRLRPEYVHMRHHQKMANAVIQHPQPVPATATTARAFTGRKTPPQHHQPSKNESKPTPSYVLHGQQAMEHASEYFGG